MKKLIMELQNNRQVFAFAVIGLLLIIFPNEMGKASPYVLGITLLLYGALNLFINLKYPDSSVRLGDGVISIVIGGVLLFQKEESISILGVVWAVISLYEAARKIDEYRKDRKFSIVGIITIVISIGLAVLLITNPFTHYYTHVRILGLEIIASVLARGLKNIKSKKRAAEQ